MVDTLEADRPQLAAMFADRRRSGRRDYESAHLIALLRDRSITCSDGMRTRMRGMETGRPSQHSGGHDCCPRSLGATLSQARANETITLY
jgi:hypothetical protein